MDVPTLWRQTLTLRQIQMTDHVYMKGVLIQTHVIITHSAIIDDNSCEYSSCAGCTDDNFLEYDSSAIN